MKKDRVYVVYYIVTTGPFANFVLSVFLTTCCNLIPGWVTPLVVDLGRVFVAASV